MEPIRHAEFWSMHRATLGVAALQGPGRLPDTTRHKLARSWRGTVILAPDSQQFKDLQACAGRRNWT